MYVTVVIYNNIVDIHRPACHVILLYISYMFCIIIMGDLRLIGDFACAVSVSVGNCMQAGVHIIVNNIVMYCMFAATNVYIPI